MKWIILISIVSFRLQFYQLVNLAKEKHLIVDEDIKNLKNVVTEKMQWQKERLTQFETEFFAGKCEGNAAPLAGAVPAVTLNLI